VKLEILVYFQAQNGYFYIHDCVMISILLLTAHNRGLSRNALPMDANLHTGKQNLNSETFLGIQHDMSVVYYLCFYA
jgi:hypothetical protein